MEGESFLSLSMQGWGDASLVGPIGKSVVGYFMPAEQWPDEVKQWYRYDPEAAEKLLDEAGYPRGADGKRMSVIFQKYEFVDLGYYQIAMDYLWQIGIDVEIRIVPRAEWGKMGQEQSFIDLHSEVWAAEYGTPTGLIAPYWSQNGWRPQNVNDAMFDKYFENALAATTLEEQKEWLEGRPARRRDAVGDQGATGATVRCHPAVDQGIQRGNRSRHNCEQILARLNLGRPGAEEGDGALAMG